MAALLTVRDSFRTDFEAFKAQKDGRFPCEEIKQIVEDIRDHPYENHAYMLHCGWAARRVAEKNPQAHADFGSSLYFSLVLSAFVPTTFYDIRRIEFPLPRISWKRCDLTNIPEADNSLPSISCLHVIEHVGLGRYGDALDASGDIKAARELTRVLAPGGTLVLVLPMDKQPRVIFNSERLYSYELATNLFPDLQLERFAYIPDYPVIWENCYPVVAGQQTYGTGLFVWNKPC